MPDRIQQRALETWYTSDDDRHYDLKPSAMGLAGEVGELGEVVLAMASKASKVLDIVKKLYYKPGYSFNPADLLDELGDVLFYLAIIAYQNDVTLDELSRVNYAKLTERENNGTGYNRGME